MSTLKDIRLIVERYTGAVLDDLWVVNVCNDAQSEFSLSINIQDTDQITLLPSVLEYPLPPELKIINRLWLQSDVDAGIDKEFTWPYRTYNGRLILRRLYGQEDTLNIDYYRHMKYFTEVTDEVDLDERYNSLYTSYALREYYDIPSVRERLGESQARKEWEKHHARYLNIQRQATSYYEIQNEPVTINERW